MDHSSPGFSVQKILPEEYWSEFPNRPPKDLPNRASKSHLLCFQHWQVDALPLAPTFSPYWEDPLEEEMAPRFSILAWRIPQTEESCGATLHRVTQS